MSTENQALAEMGEAQTETAEDEMFYVAAAIHREIYGCVNLNDPSSRPDTWPECVNAAKAAIAAMPARQVDVEGLADAILTAGYFDGMAISDEQADSRAHNLVTFVVGYLGGCCGPR